MSRPCSSNSAALLEREIRDVCSPKKNWAMVLFKSISPSTTETPGKWIVGDGYAQPLGAPYFGADFESWARHSKGILCTGG